MAGCSVGDVNRASRPDLDVGEDPGIVDGDGNRFGSRRRPTTIAARVT
jgi:hypothetical protein